MVALGLASSERPLDGGFGILVGNLMMPGAVQLGSGYPIIVPTDGQEWGFDALEVFERCAGLVAGERSPRVQHDATMPSAISQWAARRSR